MEKRKMRSRGKEMLFGGEQWEEMEVKAIISRNVEKKRREENMRVRSRSCNVSRVKNTP